MLVERILECAVGRALPGARPGLILFVQTFGDLANFNPHVHVLAADGAFGEDGSFTVLPPVPRTVLEATFRKGVLRLVRRVNRLQRKAFPTIPCRTSLESTPRGRLARDAGPCAPNRCWR